MEGLGTIKSYPLSDSDIRKILGNDIKILTYADLAGLQNINQAFDKKGRCILLYLTESNTAGHWVCMLNKGGTIEYFDPYGEPPNEPLETITEEQREEYGEDEPYLTNLMKASGKKVIYNTHGFQKDKQDINTCGRHSVVRCLYAPYSLKKYKSVMDSSGMSPDNFVSALTAQKLGK
jgi:hypothetical protein